MKKEMNETEAAISEISASLIEIVAELRQANRTQLQAMELAKKLAKRSGVV